MVGSMRTHVRIGSPRRQPAIGRSRRGGDDEQRAFAVGQRGEVDLRLAGPVHPVEALREGVERLEEVDGFVRELAFAR